MPTPPSVGSSPPRNGPGGSPLRRCRALVCAIVGEALRESGVLLTGTESSVVADTGVYADARAALTSGDCRWRASSPSPGWCCGRIFAAVGRTGDARGGAAAVRSAVLRGGPPRGAGRDGATTEVESGIGSAPRTPSPMPRPGEWRTYPPRGPRQWIPGSSSVAEVLACERRIRRIMPRFVQDGERIVMKLS